MATWWWREVVGGRGEGEGERSTCGSPSPRLSYLLCEAERKNGEGEEKWHSPQSLLSACLTTPAAHCCPQAGISAHLYRRLAISCLCLPLQVAWKEVVGKERRKQ